MNETPGEKLIRIQTEFYAMPEQEISGRLQRLHETLRLFSANASELSRMLALHAEPRNAKVLWALKNRERFRDLQREVMRLLHNFVASAFTLVDHTRRIYRKHYEPHDLIPQYSDKKDHAFKLNPLHNFMKDLRQFFLHMEMPIVTAVLEMQSGATHLQLKRHVLERFENWSSATVVFLDENAWTVDLARACDSYVANVVAFHDWFRRELEILHARELAVLNAKCEELEQVMRDAGFH